MVRPFTFMVDSKGVIPEGARKTCVNAIAQFAGKKIHITIAEAKDKRSLNQNALYWELVEHVRAVRADHGDVMSEDEVHEALLEQFAPRTESKGMDKNTYIRPVRSSAMNVEMMNDYITSIIAYMANAGFPFLAKNSY